jgi:hypothetical protein
MKGYHILRPLTAAEHFEAELAMVPDQLFGMKSAMLALYTVLTEDRAGYLSREMELTSILGNIADTLTDYENRIKAMEEKLRALQPEQGHEHPYQGRQDQ